jgi:osmotically-inducible protein OsmY
MSTNSSVPGEALAHLRAQLQQACGRDPLVQTTAVHLHQDGDVVTITGLVPHVAAKNRISEVAARLAPELPLDNCCVVDATQAPPAAELAERAGDWLLRTFPDDAGAMSVIIANGKVHLRGTWPNTAAVRLAQQTIGQYPGIAAIDTTGITLRHVTEVPAAGIVPFDEISLVNTLEAALTQSGYRLGNWVDGHMSSGNLTLVGVVDDAEARRRMVEVASHLRGVRRVDDQVVTRKGSTSRNRIVEARVQAAWSKAAPKVATPDLVIFVNGGQAFIGGRVDKPEAKELAIAIAQKDPAIRQVIDHIRVVTRRSRPA